MNSLLSRFKYPLLTCFCIGVSIFLIFYFMFPKMQMASEIFVSVRSEVANSGKLGETAQSPDSLVAEYRRISSELDSYVNVPVSFSRILTFILDASKEFGVNVQDLSTGEVVVKDGNLEYPVKFKVNSEFPQFHRFLTSLENGKYCVKIENVDMKPGVVLVGLSVLSKAGFNE